MTTYRHMYDSTTLDAIPANATMVAGYVDGSYANIRAIRQRWPHAIHVTITVTGADLSAQVVDCESRDTTPASAARWAKRKIAAKAGHPTIYCSASVWPTVKAEVAKAGIARQVSYWIAHYDNDPTVPAGAVAKQYRSTNKPNLDYSVVVDYWPGVDAAPKPPPTPTPLKTAPKPVAKAQPAPTHPAPSSAQRRASLLHRLHMAYLAKLHRLHVLHARRGK